MKLNRSKTSLLTLVIAAASLIPLAIHAASTVTFDNKSGKPALVKLTGPTSTSIEVPNGE
jgi:hypothetical protein